jgi:hypothetical protein
VWSVPVVAVPAHLMEAGVGPEACRKCVHLTVNDISE